MQDLDLMIFLIVFQEMLGPLLWILVLLAVAGITAFVTLVIKDKGISAQRLVLAQVAGLIGGAVALVLMAEASSSGFTDAGGPVDWFLIALVFGAGLIGTTILIYAITGWSARCRQHA